ncbi:MAG: nickel pincer cofactor biosynthesis protein LarC [Ruthenibacterium sp.]
MSTLYLECNMGAAGDMLAAALYELCDDAQKAEFLRVMQGLHLPHVTVVPQSVKVCGVAATHMTVTVAGHEEAVCDAQEPAPAHLKDSFARAQTGHSEPRCADTAAQGHAHKNPPADIPMVAGAAPAHHHAAHGEPAVLADALALPDAVRENVKAVYAQLADAESRVHGVPVTEVHFHEVGALDAVADIAAVCLLLYLLHPDAVIASPVATGSGTVQCAHGILPVPAPATALLLAGVPVWAGPEKGELCTPTGAALLRRFVTRFGPMPGMTVEKIGCGAGKKHFATANLLRAFWGTASAPDGAPAAQDVPAPEETVAELCCNLDDATGEELGFAVELLLRAGALDAFTAPIGMKKCRPGTLLTVLCRPAEAECMAALLLRHTPTLGVRRKDCVRYTLPRSMVAVETPYGVVHVKTATGCGQEKAKPEYDDVAQAALRAGVSFAVVRDAALRALSEVPVRSGGEQKAAEHKKTDAAQQG